MLNISFIRGDSFEKGFNLIDSSTHEPILTQFDDIYFTVKRASTDRRFLLQKKLSDGGIQSDGNGHYTIYIEPNDTDGMAFGEYVFDIEIKSSDFVKTFFGELELLQEVTHCYNE